MCPRCAAARPHEKHRLQMPRTSAGPGTRSPQACLVSARTLSVVLMRLTESCWSGSSFASRCDACARRCLGGRVFRARVAGSSSACTRNQAFPCIAQRSSANLDEDHRAQHSRHAALPPALWVGLRCSVLVRRNLQNRPSSFSELEGRSLLTTNAYNCGFAKNFTEVFLGRVPSTSAPAAPAVKPKKGRKAN